MDSTPIGVEPHVHYCNEQYHVTADRGRGCGTRRPSVREKLPGTASGAGECCHNPSYVKMTQGKKKKRVNRSVLLAKKIIIKDGGSPQGFGSPSVYHAVIVIFLEFFAWGLLTAPTLVVLHETFPKHTFLMNGLIQGVKGLLSFLSAPLIGALSDVWGRKSFLLLTVFFTCAPIPLMKISPWWYFAVISVSGVFAVTFSVVFAYVADITQEHERSMAYGLVSATFAASLVTSPAIGAYLSHAYGDSLVVLLATAIALLDICFILVAVPESLPEKMRPASWGAPISWEQADPFASLKKVGQDSIVLLICITVFLSYLPEAGQYSSFFLYLRQIMKFSPESVAAFIAVFGNSIYRCSDHCVKSTHEVNWKQEHNFAGPWFSDLAVGLNLVSALVSRTADADQQGVVQGMITGIRGLCNGLGPALYGFIFYIFHVELNENPIGESEPRDKVTTSHSQQNSIIPGPPFLFGACSVLLALLVALFIPEHTNLNMRSSNWKKHGAGHSHPHSPPAPGEGKEPLLQDTNVSVAHVAKSLLMTLDVHVAFLFIHLDSRSFRIQWDGSSRYPAAQSLSGLNMLCSGAVKMQAGGEVHTSVFLV
ncbi:unnamed protein product [Ranitomeya imitator]|uniref:Major facilitator superfamily (MFS) profile domain-containing protein n=1 Tax=Ranitomeya imitator TaxID=111125 RepID=A0ABN9MFT1_9NEOB|nr:unnamed protein product [Ranitomeya imitator]